jgi:hypothetical protein
VEGGRERGKGVDKGKEKKGGEWGRERKGDRGVDVGRERERERERGGGEREGG